MPTTILRHRTTPPSGTSPFDQAMLAIAAQKRLWLASPYITLAYLQSVLPPGGNWRVLTDVHAWLRSERPTQRQRVITFLGSNLRRVRHSPLLHAKVAVGSDSAMAGSANFTDAGFRRRNEVSVLFEGEPQVEELAEWHEGTWSGLPALTGVDIRSFERFAAALPEFPLSDEDEATGDDQPAHVPAASLAPRGRQRRVVSIGQEVYANYGHRLG